SPSGEPQRAAESLALGVGLAPGRRAFQVGRNARLKASRSALVSLLEGEPFRRAATRGGKPRAPRWSRSWRASLSGEAQRAAESLALRVGLAPGGRALQASCNAA